jgi:hypothetical protein
MGGDLPVVWCPHCNRPVQIVALNCRIFRCGQFIKDCPLGPRDGQLPPHASRAVCERAVGEGLIYGCGKPFMVHGQGDQLEAKPCDYI